MTLSCPAFASISVADKVTVSGVSSVPILSEAVAIGASLTGTSTTEVVSVVE